MFKGSNKNNINLYNQNKLNYNKKNVNYFNKKKHPKKKGEKINCLLKLKFSFVSILLFNKTKQKTFLNIQKKKKE